MCILHPTPSLIRKLNHENRQEGRHQGLQTPPGLNLSIITIRPSSGSKQTKVFEATRLSQSKQLPTLSPWYAWDFKSQPACKPNLHNILIYVTEINGY